MARARRGVEGTERRRPGHSGASSPGRVLGRRAASDIRWRAAVIVLAGAIAYSNSLSGPFILDDAAAIAGNRTIRQLFRLSSVLFPDPNSSVAGRPLVNLSFAINYAIGELGVRGYHVWNITVHLLCALVLFGIVRRTLEGPRLGGVFGSRSTDLAFAASLIWTLHPLNTETVNYITQRTESMMALCYLLTLYCSIRSHGSDGGSSQNRQVPAGGAAWQGAAVAACCLGMFCKETMVTAPIAVVLWDRAYVFRSFGEAFRARWRFYASLALMWFPLAAANVSGPRAGVAGFSAGFSSWTYLLNQAVVLLHYLRLAVWPRGLVVFYGWPLQLTLADVMPQALAILALLLATLAALMRRPAWGFPGALFFLTLAPTSTVIPITTEVGAERRMYLALAGLVALAVVGVVAGWEVARRRWLRGDGASTPIASVGGLLLLGAICVALAAGTRVRNREYATAVELARTVVERRPTSVAHHILGAELAAAGRHDEAVAELRKAIDGDSRARYDLGLALFNTGRPDEAVAQLQAFVATWRLPYRLVPRWLEPPASEVITARETMARAFAAQQRWTEAADQARAILAIYPSHVEARGLLAHALLGAERVEEAIVEFREYLESRPDDLGALMSAGAALAASGRTGEAIPLFRRTIELDPKSAVGHRNLANALYDERHVADAAPHAQEAIKLNPADPGAHDLLGRIWAVSGRLDDARREFERALQIDPAYGEARENLRRLMSVRGVR